jgi:demethylspheroidene O-methyltransferase
MPTTEQRRARALSADQVAEYSALMSASQPLVARRRCSTPTTLSRHRLPARRGWRRGHLPLARGRAARPRLRLTPASTCRRWRERARRRFAAQGIGHRARGLRRQLLPTTTLPAGADLASLVRVHLRPRRRRAR